MQHQDLGREMLFKAELKNLQDEGCQDTELLQQIEQALNPGANEGMDDALWGRIDAANKKLLKSIKEPSDLPGIPGTTQDVFLIFSQKTIREPIGMTRFTAPGWRAALAAPWASRSRAGRVNVSASIYRRPVFIRCVSTFRLSTLFPQGLELWGNYEGTTLGNIQRMVRDDDTDYTVIALRTLEKYGRDFKPQDIGSMWLLNLPYGSIFTAEAIAYRNMINEMDPPRTASFRNPYREYIGAQIRGDMWGYVNPGDPERAAEMAFRDASVSHTKNGIYGEMWAAACISAAFVLDDPREIILTGLNFIPAESRLTQAVLKPMQWVDEFGDWETVRDKIEEEYAGMSSIHVINNTCLIVMGLLLGKGDLGETPVHDPDGRYGHRLHLRHGRLDAGALCTAPRRCRRNGPRR